MKSFGFVFSILIIAIIGYAGYYFYNQTYEETLEEIALSPVPPFPTVDPSQTATDSAEASGSGVTDDWKTFVSKYGYTLRYPKNMQFNTTTEGDRLFYLGPTQSLGTELFDGISILIRSNNLNGKTLRQVADEQQAQIEKEITTESITKTAPVTFGVHKGFTFTSKSLGEGDYIYLPMENDLYIQIVSMTAEPETSKEDYESIARSIISSITF